MTNKKLLQIAVIVAVAAALFTSILLIGMQKIRQQQTENTTTQPPTVTTEAPTTAPATTVPFVTIDGNRYGDTDDTTQPTTAPITNTTAPASSTNAQGQGFTIPQDKNGVIQAYVNAVNALKTTPNFTLEKTETLNVQIDEMTPSSMRSLADKIIAGNTKNAPTTYRFSGGSDSASGKSATYVIAPAGKNAALDPTIVTSATATPSAGGGCMLTINLGAETQTVSSVPAKHSACMDVLTVEAMGLPSSARINEMTVHYNNSSITALLDSQGRLTEMQHRLVVTDATAEGSYVMSVTTRMHGDATGLYKITY